MKLIILDRDGVINYDSPHYIKSLDEWQPIPGSIEAIAQLKHAGYHVAVATNQSGIGRGLFNYSVTEAIHQKLQQLLAEHRTQIDYFAVCPHHPDDLCACRKPKAGLLVEIGDYFRCSLVDVPVIGDSLRDLQAAEAVKASPILVLTGNGSKTQTQLNNKNNVRIFSDLKTATDNLLDKKSS